MEFSLHKQQCLYLFKRKKKVGKPSDVESWWGRKGVLCPGHWGNCSKPVHPYTETVLLAHQRQRSLELGLAAGRAVCETGGLGPGPDFGKRCGFLASPRGWHSGWGKTNKQVCSKACRRNYISFGRTPLPPQGKKHPVRERKLPANGRKLNGRTASARLLFAFCQEKKKRKWKEKRWLIQDSSGQREAAQVGTGLFTLIIRHPAEGEGEFWSLHLGLSFNLPPFNRKHFPPFLHFTQRAKVGDGCWKPSCGRAIPPQTPLCRWASCTWSGMGAIAPPPSPWPSFRRVSPALLYQKGRVWPPAFQRDCRF